MILLILNLIKIIHSQFTALRVQRESILFFNVGTQERPLNFFIGSYCRSHFPLEILNKGRILIAIDNSFADCAKPHQLPKQIVLHEVYVVFLQRIPLLHFPVFKTCAVIQLLIFETESLRNYISGLC